MVINILAQIELEINVNCPGLYGLSEACINVNKALTDYIDGTVSW